MAILRQMMRFLEQHGHHTRAMLAVPTHRRRWIDSQGAVVRDDPELLPFSSWDAVYQSLCSMVAPGVIHYGRDVASVSQDAEGVELRFHNGTPVRADMLIAADGTSSRLRSMLFPDNTVSYAGYLAWRGLVSESAFDPADVADLVENITLLHSADELFITFLIPGQGGSLEPGQRRFNWLWYRNEPDKAAVDSFLTDRDGRRHHASVAPGELSQPSLSYLRGIARDRLPPVLSRLVSATDAPFLQAISDASSPSFAIGRIALVGDAACTLRPHTASGTSKAADDAVSLAQALQMPQETEAMQLDVEGLLANWAQARRRAVEPLMLEGPKLAHSFGLGYP